MEIEERERRDELTTEKGGYGWEEEEEVQREGARPWYRRWKEQTTNVRETRRENERQKETRE